MTWRPRISLVWLGTCSFAALELMCLWAYHFRWYDRESILFLASITGGAFVLYSYLRGVEDKFSQAADKFVERWNTSMVPTIKATRPFVEGQLASARFARPVFDYASASAEQIETRSQIVTLLNFFEEVSISVLNRSADEDKLRRFFGEVIPAGYKAMEEWILAERKKDNDTAYYLEAQRVVERWTGVKRREI